ncbi:MAG: polysaccharide deacetylase, carbohydrate Esterase Family 4-like protein [Bacteroidetes bacterium]|jgi:polysaccharide deacetylase family protein (PEP-CTERM system associated)|nr:polysaccharide deacetylase, carbohydrate Esterase Family 4-like protein [Bacteroidota bacterium]
MKGAETAKIYLFSIDLEDVRLWMKGGEQYKERVPANTHAYMNWLNRHGFKCTFFTVGEVAEKYPSLIKEIISEGHEIACHTNKHITLDLQTPEEFRTDIEKSLEHFARAGAMEVKGFRAPVFSLTEKTSWAHQVLYDLGFTYSTSVLPAKNPLFGWESFGPEPKRTGSGILEIPMTVGKIGPLNIPYGGGTYFRLLPKLLIKRKLQRHLSTQTPLLGYFHPYDIDTEQERFMHPGINNSMLYNRLMYVNRSSVFNKLDMIIANGFSIHTYQNYIRNFLFL